MSHPYSDQYTLETPENIEVNFELAGLGTRFCAMLYDSCLIGLVVFALFIIQALFGSVVWSPRNYGRSGSFTEWMFAVIVAIVIALLSGGYFMLCEWLMRGQTPGKRRMNIRVIHDDGTPATGSDILIRNILRFVDFLPFAYGLGVLVMFPNPLCKRLGDIAAGTIVVKEGQLDYAAAADKKAAREHARQLISQPVEIANTELTADERRLLVGFMQRRSELLPEARDALAERLARSLAAKHGGVLNSPEDYLERLLEGRHYESR